MHIVSACKKDDQQNSKQDTRQLITNITKNHLTIIDVTTSFFQNIIDQLNAYASSHPHLVKSVKSIGKSHEGRDLFAIHITAASKSSTKPLIWIMAGQHAREWIAPASTMFFIHLLLNSNETNLLHKYEFAVVPLANPDGYEYSRNTNRIWRKNRRIPYGVDLNRNWDHRWCEIGTNPRVL